MPGPSLGTNLTGIADYATNFPFLNHFSTARPWFTQSGFEWDTGQADLLDLDANGWIRDFTTDGSDAPFDRVTTVLFANDDTAYRPAGRYILDYEGAGTIDFGLNVRVINSESRPGHYVLELPENNSTILRISITDTDPDGTGDYIRNIRLYEEAHADLINAGEIFLPEYLEKIQDFRLLRFMDMMDTNNSGQSDWADRPTPGDASWSNSGGVPVEILVELANLARADAWFTIPHLATDEYIREFASYVRDNLDPGLVARFEFSNEVWNFGFAQTHWARDQAEALWGEGVTGGWMQYYGVRSAEMATIVADVFGDETGTRALNVLATQGGWLGLENFALNAGDHVAAGGDPPKDAPFHILAIAPYFGGYMGSSEMSDQVDSWIDAGEQGFLDALEWLRSGDADSTLASIGTAIRYFADVATSNGWQLEAYEAGQHIVDSDGLFGGAQSDAQTGFFTALVLRPEMADIYAEYLQLWQDQGGGLLAQYTDIGVPSRYGSWGIWETVYGEDTPRAAAIVEWRDSVGAWWDDSRDASTFANGQLIDGTMGRDALKGGALQDRLFGLKGADNLNGRGGADLMFGGDGADNLRGGQGFDALFGGGGQDILEGGAGRDVLNGGGGHDLQSGRDGNDILRGQRGQDTLFGGKGRDELTGGKGDDQLIGGAGRDSFIFTAARNQGSDTVTDFQDGLDHIVIGGGRAFDDLTISASGDNTLIIWRGTVLTLVDVDVALIDAADFEFV